MGGLNLQGKSPRFYLTRLPFDSRWYVLLILSFVPYILNNSFQNRLRKVGHPVTNYWWRNAGSLTISFTKFSVRNRNAGSTTIPSQGHLDTYVLDPSVSNEQLFSIIDYSPSWAFEGSEVKVFSFDMLMELF